jgi:hypothetical protein
MSAIHDKIRKLLAVAHGNANEAESEVAMKMAATLMAKHQITQDELGVTKEDVMEGDLFEMSDKWQFHAAHAAGVLYGATPVRTRDFGWVGFVGRPSNINAAQDTMAYIVVQVEALYKAALPKGLTKRARAEFREDFKKACALRVYQRCLKIVDDLRREKDAVKGVNALVVQDHFKKMKEENEAFLSDRPPLKPSKALLTKQRIGSFVGHKAGDLVEINRTVE